MTFKLITKKHLQDDQLFTVCRVRGSHITRPQWGGYFQTRARLLIRFCARERPE